MAGLPELVDSATGTTLKQMKLTTSGRKTAERGGVVVQ